MRWRRNWRISPTRRCGRAPRSSSSRSPTARALDDILVPAFATVREAAKRTLGQRHFDVQLIGGMILHEGRIAEMKTGEGKTLVATLAGLSQCARRPRRARRDGQRLPRQARLRMDGADLQLPRAQGRRDRARARRRAAQGGLRLRRHLRHQQRARLRLSARQHEVPAGGHGPARAHLRHRRRGRLDPDRRGAHAADHLRSARRPLRVLQHHRRLHPAAGQGRLRGRREAAHGDADRSRHGEDGADAARRRPAQGRLALRRRERLDRAPRQPGACARTSCSSATRTTSCATARSSSSTSSPAA